MTLREKVAKIIDPLNYMKDGEARLSFERADEILAIPEIKETLRKLQPSPEQTENSNGRD
jgi:hypothetical protein